MLCGIARRDSIGCNGQNAEGGSLLLATITFSQTLGTALGDWIADSGLGYDGGALVFGAALALVAAAYYRTKISHVILFWAAFILTRPLGATVGDYLDKPLDKGGLDVSRPLASAIIGGIVIACIIIFPQRAGEHPMMALMDRCRFSWDGDASTRQFFAVTSRRRGRERGTQRTSPVPRLCPQARGSNQT